MEKKCEETAPKVQRWRVQFKNKAGAIFTNEIEIDLAMYDGISRLGDHPLNEIADGIKKIEDHLKSLTTGFRHLKVDTHTHADRERERKELEEYWRSQGAASSKAVASADGSAPSAESTKADQ